MDAYACGYRFRLDAGDGLTLWFCDANGLEMAAESTPAPRKLPGITRYSNITLRRGMAGSPEALAWATAVGAKDARKSVTITALSEDGGDAFTWQAKGAWPVKCAVDETGIVTLDLAREETTRPR